MLPQIAIPKVTIGAVWRLIGFRGAIAILLGLALAVAMWRAAAISDRAKGLEEALTNEKTAHRITAASLVELEGRLARFIDEGKRRERAAREAQERQQAISAGLTLEIERIRAERAAGGKSGAGNGMCATSAAVMQAKGL